MSVKRRSDAAVAVCVMVVAAMISGCAASASPSGAATPSTPVPVSASPSAPSASGAPTPPASPLPAVSPTSPVDRLTDVPLLEGALNALWLGDGTAVAGGFAGPVFTSTILVFADGAWSVADVPTSPGQVAGIAKVGDRLIAVGNGLPDIPNAYIWDSADGRIWREVQVIENAALYDVVAGDGVVVAVGARLDSEMNSTATAWSSTDGTTWKRATVADSDGTAMGSVAWTRDGFAATGDRPLGKARPFWAATSATSWDSVENDLSDQLLPIDLVQFGDGLALAGASGKSGDQHPFVALSADGRNWERTNLSAKEGYASAVAMAGQRLVVAGVDADRLTVWWLGDGDWRVDTFELSGASISALTWSADWGLVAVGVRDGRHAVWSLGNS